MNAEEISQALTHPFNGAFPYQKNIVVPNVRHGFLDYEADLLVVTGSNYLKEIEIKTSLADLRADNKKTKHANWERPTNFVCELYYAMPSEIFEKVKNKPPVPDHAGILVIYKFPHRTMIKFERQAKRRQNVKPLTTEQVLQIARLGTMRYWSRSKNIC